MKRLALSLAVTGVLGVGAAWADDEPGRGADARADSEPHKEGVYGGVNPGARDAGGGRQRKPTARKTLHWIGFQADDGRATVFLQAVEPFTLEQEVVAGAVVLHVDGLTKLGRNTRRPIETRYFDGPVTRITAKARKARRAGKGHPRIGAGLDVTIAFRDGKASAGAVRTATEADGMYYAYLTFAAGAATPSE